MNRQQKNDLMIDYLLRFVGIPYHYGGKVPQDGGIDCSGLIIEGLRAVGDWGYSIANAQNIYNGLAKDFGISPEKITKGDILFFGKDLKGISHIAVAISEFTMIESGGTDQNGMVRLRPITWRRDRIAIIRLI